MQLCPLILMPNLLQSIMVLSAHVDALHQEWIFFSFSSVVYPQVPFLCMLMSLQSLCVGFVMMSIQRCFFGLCFEYVWKQGGLWLHELP